MELKTYKELVKDAERALEWLGSIGIRISGTRFVRYRYDLDEIAELASQDELDSERLRALNAVGANAHHEISDPITIHDAFGADTPPEVVARLRQAITGPGAYRDERSTNASSRARDVMLELVIASILSGPEVEIIWDGIADVVLRFRDCVIFVECKRPSSFGRVPNRLSKGLKQLARHCRSSSPSARCKGILAFSLDKLVNPAFTFISVPDRSYLSAALEKESEPAWKAIREAWGQRSTSPTIGAVTHLRCPILLRREQAVLSCQQTAFFFRGSPRSPNRELFLGLTSAVSDGELRMMQ